MKAVILNMTVDKRRWLQCCLKSSTHAGIHTHTNTPTHKQKECRAWRNNVLIRNMNAPVFYFMYILSADCFTFHTHPHILVSSVISIITLEVLLCHFIHVKVPHRHPDKCIGHLTHAPHVSEYISTTLLSHLGPKNTMFHMELCGWVALTSTSESAPWNVIQPSIQNPYCISCPNVSSLPWCFTSPLSDCCRSKDSNLWAEIWRSTFWNCWHAWHCPNTDLFDTASICMYALLTCALLTFPTLTELNRSETLAC